jgi:hypothetical protein
MLGKKPFQPFRITLTDGRSYEIRHPELAVVGRSTVFVGFPAPDEPEPIYDRYAIISLLHIMQLEPVGSSAAGPQQ